MATPPGYVLGLLQSLLRQTTAAHVAALRLVTAEVMADVMAMQAKVWYEKRPLDHTFAQPIVVASWLLPLGYRPNGLFSTHSRLEDISWNCFC
ncbi:MAG: hypothetical protein ACRC9V_11730 [Aeromonas sp.]